MTDDPVLRPDPPCHDPHLLAGNRHLAALCRSGRLSDALRLFDEMPRRDAVSFSTLISALSRRHPSAAHRLFRRMLAAALPPSPFTLCATLRASTSAGAGDLLSSGEQTHALAVKTTLSADPFVAAALVNLYFERGQPDSAIRIFDSTATPTRTNPFLWTALVAGLARSGDAPAALHRFRLMRAAGVGPTRFTLPGVLTACGSESAAGLGSQVHALAVRTGFGSSPFVQSSLVGFYARVSDFGSAKRVLDSAESPDPVSWNALIVRCSRAGLQSRALHVFAEMRHRGIHADEFAYPSALNSVASGGPADTGSTLHSLATKSGFEAHQHVANALVDMYAKSGRLACARRVLDQMPGKDVVTWTALLTGLTLHAAHDEALQLYLEMRTNGVDPDEFVMSSVLSCCAELTLLELGRQIHAVSLRLGLDSFVSVGNSLVSMYAKSGSVDEARTVFDLMGPRDAITWTALIVGYAQNGGGKESLLLYDDMVRSGARPDYVTFIGLLFACSHAGLLEPGRAHFDSMEKVYGITPGPDHYACMIDLLGRSGRVEEAVRLLDQMKIEPDVTVLKALLAACRAHRNVALAERVAERIFALGPTDAVPYVLLSNLYSAARRWSDVARVRALMKTRGVTKEPGVSWVEAGGRVHMFHVEDRGHERTAEIYSKVEEMMGRIKMEEGYVADTDWVLQDVDPEGREAGLAHHSEKLAVAFGLLSVPRGAPIRVYKNLRVCGDCHTAIKMVADVYERQIILRDSNCFHHISEGKCSCGDYW